MKPKLKKYDIIEIVWTDTNIPEQSGWMSESEHKQWASNAGSSVRSVGIYVSEDKDFINLVGDMEADQDIDSKQFLRPINIGKGFIKTMRKLK